MFSTPQEAFDAYISAVNAADVAQALSIYAEDVRVFDAFNFEEDESFEGWQLSGRNAWSKHVETWFGEIVPGDHTEYRDLEIIESGDVAFVSALILYAAEMRETGKIEGMWNRYNAAMRKRDTGWQIVFEHTSMPVKMEHADGYMVDSSEA